MTETTSTSRGVSVVVPCRNRATHVDRLLESLSWSTWPRDRFEVVVCDDGGADDTRSVVEAWGRRGLQTRYHRVRPPGRARNNAIARNAGLRLSRHPIVLNTDSDSVFVTDVLSAVVAEMVDGVFCSCGSYRALTRAASAELDAIRQDRYLAADDYVRRANGRPDQVDSPDGVKALHGAFACRRETLTAVGGYDERFTQWGWEDRDLLTRLECGFGLQRRFVQSASVVHVWHPPHEGTGLRADLARDGEVSTLALQAQLQRFRAQDLDTVCWRNAEPWDLDDRDEVFTPSAYRSSMMPGVGGSLTASGRQIFSAQVAEAEALRLHEFPSLARRFLRFTATRVWERAQRPSRWHDAVPRAFDDVIASVPKGYPVADLLESLAECALDLDDADGATRALAELASRPDGAARAAVVQARRLVKTGNAAGLSMARRTLHPVTGARLPAVRALAIELALLCGSDKRAFDETRMTLCEPGSELDEFDLILFHAYLELLGHRPGARYRVPPELAAAHARWGSNVSEHLFSVAIRAMRSGLYHAAVVLLERFVAGGAPADARLFVEGRTLHAQICERLSALTARAA